MEEMLSKKEEDLGEDSRHGVFCLFADCGASPMGAISFPEPAIPWEGNGGSRIIRDRHTKNCMSPVLRMRCK